MEIIWRKSALRAMKKAPQALKKSIFKWLDDLAEDPLRDDNNVTALKGLQNTYRRRFGSWRVVFSMDQGRMIIEVINVGPRGGIYK